MSTSPPNENPEPADPSPDPPVSPARTSRRRSLTPEERRRLGTPRTFNELEAEAGREREAKAALPQRTEDVVISPAATPPAAVVEIEAKAQGPRPKPKRGADVLAPTEVSRGLEIRHAILVLSALVIIAAVFYTGTKFNRIRYLIESRMNARELENGKKFPGLSTDELIETALAAEKRGDWQDATDRFLAAKRQNRALPGILFRVGKGAFDRGELEGADTALAHAIAFGENIPVANYYRGVIAVRRHDLPAATRFFEAAAGAEPFISDFYYYWAEALRLDQHPRDAIRRYQQAAQRTPSANDATLCRFKIRLARIEAAEAAQVRVELEEERKAGPLSVDWLMTDAVLRLQAGEIQEAARLISEAREMGVSGLFLTCAGDIIFRRAAEKHPEIATLVDVPTQPGGLNP